MANASFPDAVGDTALCDACHNGSSDIVKTLLLHGADCSAIDADGFSVLHLSCLGGDLETMEAILDRGVDVNAPLDGEAPLSWIL